MSNNPNTTAIKAATMFVDNLGNHGWINSLHFGASGNQYFLGAGHFDGTVDCFTVNPTQQQNPKHPGTELYNIQRLATTQLQAPCLSVQINVPLGAMYCAQADGAIQLWNLQTSQVQQIGQHNDMCTQLRWMPQIDTLISSGYDGQLIFWDGRTPQPKLTLPCESRILSMDAQDNVCVVALENKRVGVIDLRNPGKFASLKQHNLDTESTIISAMFNNDGYVVSSQDGRAMVEYMQETATKKSFPFRAHREAVNNGKNRQEAHVFSSMAIHPTTNTLVTAATDGHFITWDHYNKTKVLTSEKYGDPITATTFTPDGKLFAFASSYNWYRGAAGDPSTNPNYQGPKIGLYAMTEQSLKSGK